jgi:predicted Zn-dependent protease
MAEAGPSDKPAAAASPTLAAAVAAFQAGRRSEAKALCEAILARAPDDVETLHLASVIAAAQNDVETAVAMARRVIAIDPHHNEAQHNLGSLLATRSAPPPSSISPPPCASSAAMRRRSRPSTACCTARPIMRRRCVRRGWL